MNCCAVGHGRYRLSAPLVERIRGWSAANRAQVFGLFVRDRRRQGAGLGPGNTGQAQPFDKAGACHRRLKGDVRRPPTVARCVPSFELMASKYLDPEYAPEAAGWAHRHSAPTGFRAIWQRRLADVAFNQAEEIDYPWTDFRGETPRHHHHASRSAFHAMRGISAHSNGFQTCRALHLLQLLLGTVERPGGFRFKPPYPKPMLRRTPCRIRQGDAERCRCAARTSASCSGPDGSGAG